MPRRQQEFARAVGTRSERSKPAEVRARATALSMLFVDASAIAQAADPLPPCNECAVAVGRLGRDVDEALQWGWTASSIRDDRKTVHPPLRP